MDGCTARQYKINQFPGKVQIFPILGGVICIAFARFECVCLVGINGSLDFPLSSFRGAPRKEDKGHCVPTK